MNKTNNVISVWISGVTASGKTTLATHLYDFLKNHKIKDLVLLDGDILRNSLNKSFGYSPEERLKAIKEYVEIVKIENQKGKNVIISTVAHKLKSRIYARNHIQNFYEINLSCNPDICKKRDYKNIYSSLSKDECLPGITEPFEINNNAELIIDTGKNSLEVCKSIIQNNVIGLFHNMYDLQKNS